MTLDKSIENKLLVYQKDHTENLISILQKNKACLDSSDTGVGKTYCAAALCKQLKLNPIIVCPKAVITVWKRVCKSFGVTPLFVVNYESLKFGKFYLVTGERDICPYLDPIKDKEGEITGYTWHLEKYTNLLFIFDEAHKASEITSLNGKLLYSAKNTGIPILLLSATIADKVEKFFLFFYILNFIETDRQITYEQYTNVMIKWINREKDPMARIYVMLYPDRASRIKIDTLGNLFPETQITAEPYNMGYKRSRDIEKQYKIISESITELSDKSKKDKANILVKMLRAHQKIELLKIPTFVELANDFIENGLSVVIFVNYTQTLETLAEMLKTSCLIYGEQDAKTRERNIDDFMKNKSKIIICNIKAGGVGISLHDLHGRARASIISPSFNAIDMQQAFGRIHRAGAKSKSIQRIIYCADTVEENIADKLRKKLIAINTINNGDVDLTNVEFIQERKKM